MSAQPIQWPPSYCKWCDWHRKMSMSHRSNCPSYGQGIFADEIAPGLYVGNVECRPDPRFAAVVTVLTQGEILYYAKVPMPPGAMVHIDHEDREPGLLAKCTEAWSLVDVALARGDEVLIHCGAGASRSPTVLMGWLISRRGLTAKGALGLLVEKRPQVMHLWQGFVRELEAFSDEHRRASNGESGG